jgi:hypothetical protein
VNDDLQSREEDLGHDDEDDDEQEISLKKTERFL